MDDAINRIEDMATGSEPGRSHDASVGARRGTFPPKTNAMTTPTGVSLLHWCPNHFRLNTHHSIAV